MTERLIENGRRVDRAYKVADLVWRFCRQKRFAPDKTYGRIFANKVTDLSGDQVDLDMTEEVLVDLKRRKVISGRRLVNLLGQHQREVRRQPSS
tara:strand:+ start:291 stop:572 length:282 start_codon:yes stop_codon:yes gene_type:complete